MAAESMFFPTHCFQSRLTVNSELCRRDMHRSDVLIRLEPLLRLTQTLKSYERVTVVLIYTRNNQILVC